MVIFDAFVRSQKTPNFVIPANAGISLFNKFDNHWTPVFTGETTFYEIIIFDITQNVKGGL